MYLHTYSILYTVSTATRFDASAKNLQGVLSFYFAEVTKIVKVTNPIESAD